MVDILTDPLWGGIGAILTFLSLIIYVIDRAIGFDKFAALFRKLFPFRFLLKKIQQFKNYVISLRLPYILNFIWTYSRRFAKFVAIVITGIVILVWKIALCFIAPIFTIFVPYLYLVGLTDSQIVQDISLALAWFLSGIVMLAWNVYLVIRKEDNFYRGSVIFENIFGNLGGLIALYGIFKFFDLVVR